MNSMLKEGIVAEGSFYTLNRKSITSPSLTT